MAHWHVANDAQHPFHQTFCWGMLNNTAAQANTAAFAVDTTAPLPAGPNVARGPRLVSCAVSDVSLPH